MKSLSTCLLLMLMFAGIGDASAEDGHRLWLRMVSPKQQAEIRVGDNMIVTKTVEIAIDELSRFWRRNEEIVMSGSVTPISDDGFRITRKGGTITLTASTDVGMLYGAYELLRRQETGQKIENNQVVSETPRYQFRILDHWDNMDGTIERGYAGRSVFFKNGKVDFDKDIIRAYARANASIGINMVVINNVNASPKVLDEKTLFHIADIADILRLYGIRLCLSVNFASPMSLDSLTTADPLDEQVRDWWKEKVMQIYKLIPDFGGFLVKANSEGQPGPMDFGRSHADGANMLAEVLRPHGGIVMWRAFVYAQNSPDRASQAYEEFMPLDGTFMNNVILQIKNGPIDFQPREPVSPLFYGIQKTRLMPEFQITQEYTGESIHTCFLAPMWREFFDEIAANARPGSRRHFTAVSGVSNVGNSVNWCGSDMAQANWYAFGRLAWNPDMTSEQIAREWLQQTFSKADKFVSPMTAMLCQSHEAVVSYMMPLGLHHIFAGGHHYGPEPWCHQPGWREDWLPRYYHKADSTGVGFDRTRTGSGNVAQYPQRLADLYDNVETCPEKYLLFFHHVPWNSVWERLCRRYDMGVSQAEGFAETWRSVEKYVDMERYERQLKRFERQAKDAWWWRDACLLYFQQFSKMPLPQDCPAPRHKLDDLMRFRLRMDNYTAADMDKLP